MKIIDDLQCLSFKYVQFDLGHVPKVCKCFSFIFDWCVCLGGYQCKEYKDTC